MLFADIIKKRSEYFFLLFTVLIILIWFLAFPLNTPFEGTDVIIEGAYFFVAFCSFFVVKKLSINLLSLGWITFTYGLLIDLLDEFTHEPSLINTQIEGLLTATGLLLIGIGIYKGVQYLQQEIAQRKSAEEDLKKRKEQLEKFAEMATGREGRMIELKERINELEKELGKEPSYDMEKIEQVKAERKAEEKGLEELSYGELQKLAKKNDIKANQSKEKLIKKLREGEK